MQSCLPLIMIALKQENRMLFNFLDYYLVYPASNCTADVDDN